MEIGQRKVNARVYAHKIVLLRTFQSIFTYVNVRRQKRDSGNPPLAKCDRIVYAYAHSQPLALKGSSKRRVTVPKTNMSTVAEFCIVPGDANTLLGRKTSEMLAVLKVTPNLRGCLPEKKSYARCVLGNHHNLYIDKKVIKCRIR